MITYSASTLSAAATAANAAAAAQAATEAAGGTLVLRDGETVVVSIPLETVAFDVSGAVLTARGEDGDDPIGAENTLGAESSAGGTVDNYRVLSSESAVVWASDDTAGLTIDGGGVVSGSGVQITLTGWTHTITTAE